MAFPTSETRVWDGSQWRSISGPPGETGAAGPQGPQGPAGATDYSDLAANEVPVGDGSGGVTGKDRRTVVKSAADLAEAATVSGAAGDVLAVAGAVGGFFDWASTGAADGVITVAAANGYWVRQWDGHAVHAAWAGMSNVAAGATNTAALQAAIDFAISEAVDDGAKVLIGAGDFDLYGAAQVTTDATFSSRAGIVIEGTGQYTRLVQTNAAEPVFRLENQDGDAVERVTIRDLYCVDGTYGIYAPKCNTSLFENLIVSGTAAGGIYLKDCWNTTVRHCLLTSNSGRGFECAGNANGFTFDNNICVGNSEEGAYFGSFFGLTINGSVFEGNTLTGLTLFSGRGVNLSGNYFEGNDGHQIQLGEAGQVCYSVDVSGNYINGLSAGAGRSGLCFFSCEGITVTGNHFRNLGNAFAFDTYARNVEVAESNTYDTVTAYLDFPSTYTRTRLARDGVRLRIRDYSHPGLSSALVGNLLETHPLSWTITPTGAASVAMLGGTDHPAFSMVSSGADQVDIGRFVGLAGGLESLKGKLVTFGAQVYSADAATIDAIVNSETLTRNNVAGGRTVVTCTVEVGAAATQISHYLRVRGNSNVVVEDWWLVVGTERVSGRGLPVRLAAAPTTGSYPTARVVLNTSPSAAKNIAQWVSLGSGLWRAIGTGRGTTAQRPSLTAQDAGYTYWDTDLGKIIHWSGSAWDV